MPAAEPFAEFALLLLACALAGALAGRLRQPALIAYIVVGIAAGPAGFGWVRAQDQIDLLAQMGVTVLLFVVGLRLDLHQLRHLGPVALATGLGQLAFTIAFGLLIVLGLGRPPLEALYVAVALTFSSTIIIVKLLSDKHELDSLHGRIAVGFLIVQDIAVVVAMMLMSALRAEGADLAAVAGSLGLRLLLAALALGLLMRWVLPRLAAAARTPELLLLFAVGWGVALAALGEWAGFSKEAGAFVAGFSLASTPQRALLAARLGGLRDFLLVFFFIDLGARLDFTTLGADLGAAALLSAFVLVGNPLIVMAIMGWMGYRRRTGFLAGLTVAQISEFSIVFVAMGITLGHVGAPTLGLVTLVGLVTISVSSYMILYSQQLYEPLARWLAPFERRDPWRERLDEAQAAVPAPQFLVFGLGRYGRRLLAELAAAGWRVRGIDFDPERVRALAAEGLPVRFGDVEDPELLPTLALDEVPWVVSALPDLPTQRALLDGLVAHGYAGRIAVTAREPAQDAALAAVGVALRLDPFADAASHAAQRLDRAIRLQETPP